MMHPCYKTALKHVQVEDPKTNFWGVIQITGRRSKTTGQTIQIATESKTQGNPGKQAEDQDHNTGTRIKHSDMQCNTTRLLNE